VSTHLRLSLAAGGRSHGSPVVVTVALQPSYSQGEVRGEERGLFSSCWGREG